MRIPALKDGVPGSTPGKGEAERPRIRAPGACYFFLAGALAATAFGALAGDTPAAGAITFLGCLGFLASRLPRIVLFANMLLLICRSRKRPPCRPVWTHLAILSRFFFWMSVARLPEEDCQTGRNELANLSATTSVDTACPFAKNAWTPCRPASSIATNIAYAAGMTSCVRDGHSLIPRFSAFQNISFSLRPARLAQ